MVMQQWQKVYGFAVRRDVNLSNSGIAPTGGIGSTSATTVTNTGLPRGLGTQLFVSSGVYTGFMASNGAKSTACVFGLPLTNRPSWVANQAQIVTDKATGEITATAGTGYNYLRGIIGPTGSVSFQVTPGALIPFLWCLVHQGASDGAVGSGVSRSTFVLPSSSTASVEAYMTALSRYSTDTTDSQLVSDSVVTRLTISGAEGEAINATAEMMGRYLSDDFGAYETGTPARLAPNLNFIEQTPLLFQNMELVLQSGTASHIVTECQGFSLTITAEIVAKRYNNRFPIRYIMQGFTVEGTLQIPFSATTVGGKYFLEELIKTQATADEDIVNVTTTAIDFLWKTTKHGIGTTFTDTTVVSSARAISGVNDLRIAVGAVISAAPTEGNDETMINLTFTGVNIRSTNIITQPAFGIYMCQGLQYGIG